MTTEFCFFFIENVFIDRRGILKKDRDILLLNLLLYCGIDFKKITSIHFKNVCLALDPNYELPQCTDLKTKIIKDSFETMFKNNSTDDLLNVVGISVHEDNKELYVISSMLSTKNFILIIV